MDGQILVFQCSWLYFILFIQLNSKQHNAILSSILVGFTLLFLGVLFDSLSLGQE